jgi:hypothetical protein
MARRRTSPRRSGDDKNAGRNTLRSEAAILQIKAKNRNRPNYNGFSFIEVVRVRSKHTSYVLRCWPQGGIGYNTEWAYVTEVSNVLYAPGGRNLIRDVGCGTRRRI